MEDKFANTVLYLLHRSSGPTGTTKLLKLLYFTDFGHYRKYLAPVTGVTYVALPNGPVPDNYDGLLAEMVDQGWLVREDVPIPGLKPMQSYRPVAAPSEDAFTDTEVDAMNAVIEQWGKATGKAMSNATHRELPWKNLYNDDEKGAEIPYRAARWSDRGVSPAHLTTLAAALDQPEYRDALAPA